MDRFFPENYIASKEFNHTSGIRLMLPSDMWKNKVHLTNYRIFHKKGVRMCKMYPPCAVYKADFFKNKLT